MKIEATAALLEVEAAMAEMAKFARERAASVTDPDKVAFIVKRSMWEASEEAYVVAATIVRIYRESSERMEDGHP